MQQKDRESHASAEQDHKTKPNEVTVTVRIFLPCRLRFLYDYSQKE